jgi:hypothetical protein
MEGLVGRGETVDDSMRRRYSHANASEVMFDLAVLPTVAQHDA